MHSAGCLYSQISLQPISVFMLICVELFVVNLFLFACQDFLVNHHNFMYLLNKIYYLLYHQLYHCQFMHLNNCTHISSLNPLKEMYSIAKTFMVVQVCRYELQNSNRTQAFQQLDESTAFFLAFIYRLGLIIGLLICCDFYMFAY